MSTLEQRKKIRDRELEAERREAASRRVRGLQVVLAVIVLSGLSVFAYGLLGERRGEGLEEAPAEILGTWVTDLERYAGASLTIEPERLTLGFTPGAEATYPIRSIRREVAAVHRSYVITYADEQGAQEMEVFVYDGGQLRLRNPFEAVWTRVE